jgi:hypothetical protein
MLDTSRRSFLIGFGSLALATRLPLVAQLEPLSTAQSMGVFDYRALFDVMIGFDDIPPLGGPEQYATVDLMRGDTVLIHYPMNVRNTMRWVAVPNKELIFRKDDALRFTCDPGHSDLRCAIAYDTKPFNDPYSKVYLESFVWKDGVVASQEISPVSPSIEGMLRNDPTRIHATSEFYDDDEYDYDDDDGWHVEQEEA